MIKKVHSTPFILQNPNRFYPVAAKRKNTQDFLALRNIPEERLRRKLHAQGKKAIKYLRFLYLPLIYVIELIKFYIFVLMDYVRRGAATKLWRFLPAEKEKIFTARPLADSRREHMAGARKFFF